MAFDLESSSPADTGEGKVLKTGNLKRSYNMAECKPGQVYDEATKKCVMKKMPGKGKREWMKEGKVSNLLGKLPPGVELGKPETFPPNIVPRPKLPKIGEKRYAIPMSKKKKKGGY